jgi:hypothetical protein
MIPPKTKTQLAAKKRAIRKAVLKQAEDFIDTCIHNSFYPNQVTIYKSEFPILLSEKDFNYFVDKYKKGGWTKSWNYGNHIHLGVEDA